jgi:hypothetical protein
MQMYDQGAQAVSWSDAVFLEVESECFMGRVVGPSLDESVMLRNSWGI